MARGQAGPLPVWDVVAELAEADLIVAATVTTVQPSSQPVTLVSAAADPERDGVQVAEASVLRVLAGRAEASVPVYFLRGKVPSRPWLSLSVEDTLLLFLRRGDGGYVPVDPTGKPLRTRPDLVPPSPQWDAPAAVRHELEQVVSTTPASPLGMMMDAVVARIALPDDADPSLLDQLGIADPARRTAWVTIALGDGKTEVLAEVPMLFSSPSPDAQAFLPLLVPLVAELRDTAAAPLLRPILSLAEPDLAFAASTALRRLAARDLVPTLVELLDHPMQAVRYQMVLALAELNPDVDDGGPAFDRYRTDEPKYLTIWKQWWEDHQIH
ncbi:MAG TPA: hypothetical protein VFQ77_01700 [Pseudonocardiaceae bacterium]|nr:hypothetical protein [Pseudonocardiaceae bacterium]